MLASLHNLFAEVSQGVIPQHVACVMDGNGRWAAKRGLPRTAGHSAGEEALFDTIEGVLDLGISWFTVYAFSTENWRRPREEVDYLLSFSRNLLRKRLHELHERNVRICFIGRREEPVHSGLIKEMQEAEELTRGNSKMTLSVAFNYGGRAEIVDAVKSILNDFCSSGSQPGGSDRGHDRDLNDSDVSGGVANDLGGGAANDLGAGGQAALHKLQLTEADISRHLYSPDMPDPDLVIRTSGENRISNFLLWQLAYSELVFFDVLWPDFRREHLFEAIRQYQHRERRYGG